MILPILALSRHYYITGSGAVAEKGCFVYMHHIFLEKEENHDTSEQSRCSLIHSQYDLP